VRVCVCDIFVCVYAYVVYMRTRGMGDMRIYGVCSTCVYGICMHVCVIYVYVYDACCMLTYMYVCETWTHVCICAYAGICV